MPIVEEGNKRTWNPERMYLPTPAWFKFRSDVKRLDDYVSSLITKRWELRLKERESPSARKQVRLLFLNLFCFLKNIILNLYYQMLQDILDKTLAAVSDTEWGQDVIMQIRDEIKTFILAGHETSASMLAWSLYELSINPELAQKVRDEARAVFVGEKDASIFCSSSELDTSLIDFNELSLPEKSKLDQLEFTQCCLRESLRKYSVVPTVVRVAAEATNLGDYHLPKGTTLMVNMQGEYFSKSLCLINSQKN